MALPQPLSVWNPTMLRGFFVVLTSFLQRAKVILVSHSSALLAYNEKQIEFDWMEAAPGDCGQALFSGGFFCILSFLQSSCINNSAEMNFFILSLLFKAPGVCGHIRGSLLRLPRPTPHFILNSLGRRDHIPRRRKQLEYSTYHQEGSRAFLFHV